MELSKNEFVESKINTKYLKVLTLILLYVLLLGINNTYVYCINLIPFGIGLVFALLYIGFNGYILSLLYLSSSVVVGFSINKLILCLWVCLVVCGFYYLMKTGKVKNKKTYHFLFAILSILGYFVICFNGEVKTILAIFVSMVLGAFFLYSCMCFFDATIGRGFLGKVNLDEKICGCVILIIFTIGICNVNIFIVSLGYLFLTLIILIVNKLCSSGTTIMCSTLVGLAFAVFYLNPIYISMFIVLGLSSIAFKCNVRILSAIAYLLAFVIFSILFKLGISVGEIISIVLGCVVYLITPNKFLHKISEIVPRSRPVALKNIFNSSKAELVRRVKELSVVFCDMDKVYRDMVRGNLPDDKAKHMLREEIVQGVCNGCVNKNNCYRLSNSFMENCVDTIIDMGYSRQKVLLIDLPEYFTTNCINVNSFVQYLNNLLSAYFEYSGAVKNIDTSRVLIADQLCGVSNLLEALSNELNYDVSTDNKLESLIKERLSYSKIVCLEVVVYDKGINGKTISMVVRNNNINVKNIEKIVSKIIKSTFVIVSQEQSEIIGATSLLLKSKPRYDMAFGIANTIKTGGSVSGDNHLIIPLNDGKFMVSICDGMGSGKSASNISRLTISLIENFYRAGFDNEIILSSVNKLLSLNEGEDFSTIDLCVIDCKKSIYDFVKLGASDGYILRASGEVEVVKSSSLPVGVLENINPHITKLCVSPMDIVVLVSDGVADVLKDKIPSVIRNSDIINPQTLADKIMDIALKEYGGVARDDMTVVCVRVFENV